MGCLTSLAILQGWGVVGSWGHTVPTRVVLRLFVYVTFHSSPYVTLNEWAQRPALCRPQHTPHPGLSKNKSEGNPPPPCTEEAVHQTRALCHPDACFHF